MMTLRPDGFLRLGMNRLLKVRRLGQMLFAGIHDFDSAAVHVQRCRSSDAHASVVTVCRRGR